MTSVTAAARSAATREDLPTPASPQTHDDVPRLREGRGDRRPVVRPADVREAVAAPFTRSWSARAAGTSRIAGCRRPARRRATGISRWSRRGDLNP